MSLIDALRKSYTDASQLEELEQQYAERGVETPQLRCQSSGASTSTSVASVAMEHINKMKYRHYETDAQVARAKLMVRDCLRTAGVTCLDDMPSVIAPVVAAFDTINSRRREATTRKANSPHPPLHAYPRLLGLRSRGKRKLKLGSEAYAYDTRWEEVLEREFAYDPQLVTEVQLAHEQWLRRSRELRKAGWRNPNRTFSDISDGQVFQEHPELGNPQYEGPVRLAFEGYCDDVDVPNPIGVAAGHHKLYISFFVLLNRPPKTRCTLLSIHLATICLASDFKLFGPRAIISGTGHDNSIGGTMRRFDAGVNLKTSAETSMPCRGWLAVWTADGLAQGEVYGTNASFSKAINPCNLCTNLDQRRTEMKEPSGFLSCTCGEGKPHRRGCDCVFVLRTVADDLARNSAPKKPTKEQMQLLGLTTLEHGFINVPHFNVARPGPKETMHAFFEGRTKQLGACTLWSVVAEGWATETQVPLCPTRPCRHCTDIPDPFLIAFRVHS